MKSYAREREIDDNYMLDYERDYENYKQRVLNEMKLNITRNKDGKIATCKNCQGKKLLKMTHLKKQQFENSIGNKLLPLARVEGKITKTASDTFFKVIGNLNCLKEKPLIFFAGTDIIYRWNSQQAKLRLKCKLMDKSKQERRDYVKACEQHSFLQNHTYKLMDLTQ